MTNLSNEARTRLETILGRTAAADSLSRIKAETQRREIPTREQLKQRFPRPPAQPFGSSRESLVYSQESSLSFFADCYRMQHLGDTAARERLDRHGRQMVDVLRSRGIQVRDVGTGAFAGLTVPQYLIDLGEPS